MRRLALPLLCALCFLALLRQPGPVGRDPVARRMQVEARRAAEPVEPIEVAEEFDVLTVAVPTVAPIRSKPNRSKPNRVRDALASSTVTLDGKEQLSCSQLAGRLGRGLGVPVRLGPNLAANTVVRVDVEQWPLKTFLDHLALWRVEDGAIVLLDVVEDPLRRVVELGGAEARLREWIDGVPLAVHVSPRAAEQIGTTTLRLPDGPCTLAWLLDRLTWGHGLRWEMRDDCVRVLVPEEPWEELVERRYKRDVLLDYSVLLASELPGADFVRDTGHVRVTTLPSIHDVLLQRVYSARPVAR